jgi:hypothetical protein
VATAATAATRTRIATIKSKARSPKVMPAATGQANAGKTNTKGMAGSFS